MRMMKNAASDLDDDDGEQEAENGKKKDDGVFKVPAIPAATKKPREKSTDRSCTECDE